MNILRNSRVYLAGNMEYSNDDVNWRVYLTSELNKLNIKVLSPLDATFVGQHNETKVDRAELIKKRQNEEYDVVSEYMTGVVQKDLRLVDICDYIIINLEVKNPTFGTVHELIVSNQQKKPIFLSVGNKRETPLWLLGIISHKYIYNNVNEILATLQNIDSGKTPIDSDRWRLLIDNLR